MKKILTLLITHIRADFDKWLYGSVAVFLVLSIFLNYQIKLEKEVIDAYRGQPIRILWYFLLYATAYYGTIGLMRANGRLPGIFRKKEFWLYSLTGIGVLGIDPDVSYSLGMYAGSHFGHIYYFAYKLLHELGPVLSVWLPLLLFYYICESGVLFYKKQTQCKKRS